jgi:hypothetical protein
MSRATIYLGSMAARQRAAQDIMRAPLGSRVEIKAPARTLPQNARFWAMLTDIARQVTWHGLRLTTDDWKLVFLDALKREARMCPNIDGNGFVNLGRSSSDLTVAEMGDLMTIMEAFGAQHGVVFNDRQDDAA